MKKFIIFQIFLILITSCVKKVEEIKIGFCGPLTGDAANYGKLMTQAIQIAVDERNASGGIAGEIKVKFIKEDDEGKPEKANSVIEKLANIDKIYGLVGAVFSSCSLAIAPKAEKSKIVMISPSSTHKDLTSKGNFIFRTVVTDKLQAIIFAKYVYNISGIKELAILYIKNDYSQGLSEDFRAQYEKEGGKVLAIETGSEGDKDFKTQLTKIKSTGAKAIYIPNYVAEMAQILIQAKQLGLKVQFLSADGFSNPEIFNIAKDDANGVIFSNAPDERTEKRKIFEKKYEEKYGEKPDSFSLNSYDAANIIMDAIEFVYNNSTEEEKSKLNLNRDKIREYVASLKNYEGVSGTITFLENGDVAKNIAIFKTENNQYKQIAIYSLQDDKIVEVKK